MNVLMTYRLQAFKNEILPQLNKYQNDKITFIVKNNYIKNLLPILTKRYRLDVKINILTIKELLEGKLDNMQFDYIVGNPPYQNSNSKSDAGSLYIDITKKVLNLLAPTGVIDFLTPSTIAQVKKTGFTLSGQKGLKLVDYTVNECFSVGVYIIRWKIDKTYDGDVTVINSDKTVSTRKYTDVMIEDKDRLAFTMFERIKSNKNKLFVADQSTNKKRQLKKDSKYKYKIHVNYIKNKVEYSWKQPKLFGRKKLVVHVGKKFDNDNFLISNEDFGQYQHCIDITDYTEEEIKNLKTFLYNDITKALCSKCRQVYKTGFNTILYSFPKIDVSHPYTEDDVAKIFELSDKEIEYLKS